MHHNTVLHCKVFNDALMPTLPYADSCIGQPAGNMRMLFRAACPCPSDLVILRGVWKPFQTSPPQDVEALKSLSFIYCHNKFDLAFGTLGTFILHTKSVRQEWRTRPFRLIPILRCWRPQSWGNSELYPFSVLRATCTCTKQLDMFGLVHWSSWDWK